MSVYLIAEIGCNHKGSMDIAKQMIMMASTFCGVPCVKFQKRTIHEVLSEKEYNSPHPNPMHAYGETYGQHREYLEFSVDQHRELRDYCREWNVAYSCSVWDLTSTREIASLEPAMIKIPSACNTHYAMAGQLCDTFGGEIHVSLGMTTQREIEEVISFYDRRGRASDLVIYHCTSGYPVPFEDTNLLEIVRLKNLYEKEVKAIGFSGHHLGIAIDCAARGLGATFFERHFTLDRTWKGTDHAASIEPDGLRRLWRDLKACEASLTVKNQDILDIEKAQLAKLKWNRTR